MPDPGLGGQSSQAIMNFTRPFTLYEALPYTPFASIAPFDSGMFLQPRSCNTFLFQKEHFDL
jgi:cohesin loading factor subunit SCC2